MAQENFIPSIFNYCDRWCERCPFTARCAVYAANAAMSGDDLDPSSPEFWQHLNHNFKDALAKLEEILSKLDAFEQEPPAPPVKPSKPPENRLTRAQLELIRGYVSSMSEDYGHLVEDFFESNRPYFDEVAEASEERTGMGEPIDLEQYHLLKNAVETIRAYQFLIYAKIDRAFDGILDDEDGFEVQSDANGSAKVAMIAILRSIDAWRSFGGHFKAKQIEIEKLLKRLVELKLIVVDTFPERERFHRPGFDDEPHRVVRLDSNPN
jgi:hypothetical protein